MQYKGKSIELLGEKEVFGERVAWIRILEDNSFKQIPFEELSSQLTDYSFPHIRFIALAAKIKDEVAKKKILAPYESSLIPLPHQILVLEKVMKSAHNRFLLADEVGMGKTIETGLILKELKLRGEIKRTLIIVPKSAMMQWQSELKEHFNEVFHIYDSEMISSLARTFSNLNADQEFNFWEQHNQLIVSTDALKPLEKRHGWSQEKIDEYNKYRLDGVLNADFDMVIIDEAHKVGGASPTVSRFKLAKALCNAVPNVLLLSATPHRGKGDHFRRILQLIDPDAFEGEGLPSIKELEPYVMRTEKRLAVDYQGDKLFNDRETSCFNIELDVNRHEKQLALYDSITEYVKTGFNTAKRKKRNATGLIMILFQRLASSSTAAILSAMEGRLYRLKNGDDYLEDYDLEDYFNEDSSDAFDLEDVYANLSGNIEDEENLLSNLVEQAKECINNEIDAKAEAFILKYQELQQDYNNKDLKVLMFTEFRTTQKMLQDILEDKGYRCSIINGSQNIDDRKTSLMEFKEESQLMIATDAAGESLNMQFCHIVFNYDLPWNPMMIEQRIGRVDRIGQKNKVIAFNMLTSNSVDLRVYEIIENKLKIILSQLGIDKSSDVLNSAMDIKRVKKLYLQSLLDPSKFEFAGERWLYDIKKKLKEYQSTEGSLPCTSADEISIKTASDVKYSPLPTWLEYLLKQYTVIKNGQLDKDLLGSFDLTLDYKKSKITFNSEISLNNPGIEHITLQHDLIKKILSDLSEFDVSKGIPIFESPSGTETKGIWSIFQISAHNLFERKVSYHSFFISEDKKIFTPYANDLWNRIISGELKLSRNGLSSDTSDVRLELDETLHTIFQNIESSLILFMNEKKLNKIKSFEFQKSRINKIGIQNIRHSKLEKLVKEHSFWLEEFESNQKVIPGIKHLLSIKING